jgi:hypothetical protein
MLEGTASNGPLPGSESTKASASAVTFSVPLPLTCEQAVL